MNTIKTLLLLSFSILLFNCSDEEDKKTETGRNALIIIFL